MSYRRNNRGYRKRKKRSTYGSFLDKRVDVYGSAFAQLKADVAKLMMFTNTESKYVDTLFNGNTMTNGIGNISLLNGMTQGVTPSTRTGQSIKSMKLILDLICQVGATTPVNCRFLIIQDKGANGATTGVGSIFQAPVDGASDYSTSQRNVATVGYRIVFHCDEIFQLDTVQNTRKVIRKTIPLRFHVAYNTGTAGTVADISENSLYLIALSSAGAGYPTFKGSVRYEYVDN